VTVPSGALSEGGKAIAVGDKTWAEQASDVWFDGKQGYWIGADDRGGAVRAFDAATGAVGGPARPAFLDDFTRGTWILDAAVTYVLPAPRARSPLGEKDGLVGVKARYHGGVSAQRWLETIDGSSWNGTAAGECPVELLALPGDIRRRPIVVEHRRAVPAIVEPEGTYLSCLQTKDYARGQGVFLPPLWWHLYSHRDPEGSATLRNFDEASARDLVFAINAGQKSLIAAKLAGMKDARLRRGVGGLCTMARNFELRRDELAWNRHPKNAQALGGVIDDNRLASLLGTGGFQYPDGDQRGSVAAQIQAVCSALFSENRKDRAIDDIPRASVNWTFWLSSLGTLLYKAQAVGTDRAVRGEIIRLIELIAATPLISSADRMRLWTGSWTGDAPIRALEKRLETVIWFKGNAYFVRHRKAGDRHWYSILEYAPSGEFRPLGGLAMETETRFSAAISDAAVDEFHGKLVEQGIPAWSREAAIALATRAHIGLPEAALMLAGFPNLYASSILDPQLSKVVGLVPEELEAARENLRAVELTSQYAILAEAAGSDPAALWNPLGAGIDDENSCVARMVRAWKRLVAHSA
jgi:hypothetical protein